MSVSVYWTPVKPTWLKGALSSTVTALEKVFGEMPITLTANDVEKLNTMAATYDRGDANPYEQLAQAILEFGTITVSTKY